MSEESWSEFHKNRLESNYPLWPVEAMVKVFFGNYLENKPKLERGMKVLDIGCGFGNNLLPFYVKGLKCHGVEISQEIVDVAVQALAGRSIHDMEFKVGNNRSLPYPDDFFDILISNNVIHYESSEENILKAFLEYKRVLKKGGTLFLMTVGPEHTIYKRAKYLGEQRNQISDFDFRNGEIYFYFDNERKLKFYTEKFFNQVEVGRVTERFTKLDLDFLISVSTK